MTLTNVESGGETVSDTRRIELDVTGMTCVMCAAHIRHKLKRIDGVRATVGFSSGVATIETSGNATAAELCDVVRKAGYGAEVRSVVAIASDGRSTGLARSPLQRLVAFILR